MVHPSKWSIQTHFNHGKIASRSGFEKSLMGGWGQQMVLAGSCSLQRHTLQDRRVHTGRRWSKRGQLATIKANCHVANTTLAPPSSQ
jgi:hypothetical protein